MKTEKQTIKKRLEYLRKELRAERISYGELEELARLAPHIDKNDTELLEAAGVLEHPEEDKELAILILERDGTLLDSYPVDESMTVPNAGAAVLYSYKGEKYEVITWNDRAEEHKYGQKTMNIIE